MQPHILVPYDFSPAAERALRWATEHQRSIGGGSIKLLHVLPELPVPGTVEMARQLAPTDRDVKQIEASLKAVASRCAPGAAVEALLGHHVPSEVLAAAKAYPADLIVMGTHGRGGISRMVLGSVADHVVRHASCPVVTMRAKVEP